MADDKKSFDDDKTVIDIRPSTPAPDEDRTVVEPREQARPAGEIERTVRWTPTSSQVPAADEDRTVIRSGTQAPAAPAEDRTVIRGGDVPGAAATAAGEFAIVVLSGPGKGARYAVPASGALAGSGPGCEVPLQGAFPQHARLVARGEGVEVQGLGGPIKIRGRDVNRAELKSGDLFKIADVVVRIVKAGDVFSSAYTEAELAGSGVDFAAITKNPKILAIGALVVVLVGVLFWPAAEQGPELPAPAGPEPVDQRKKDVEALLASGEVLFNAGRLVAPPDQPDAENAYRAFNRVIEIDPGNDRAREWLERIDGELQKQARAREEAEAARRAREREAEEQKRAALAEKVAAILAEGDALFERGNVAEPVGANALVKYREALAVDPESREAQERERKAIYYYVGKGDELREKDDLWRALENYRKAARAADNNGDIAARVKDAEARLRSLMSGTSTDIVMYKDDRGQLFVLDDKNKVPARYKDRMVEVPAAAPVPAE